MRKLLLPLIIIFSILSIQAQANDVDREIRALTHRVDSLEHEMSYLVLSYKFSTLNNDISKLANDVYINSLEIELNITTNMFDMTYGDLMLRYYYSCVKQKQLIAGLIKGTRLFYTLDISSREYSQSERDYLQTCNESIDSTFDYLEKAIDLLKSNIDVYLSHIKP